MLKPLSSRYNDFRKNQRWVKLKKVRLPPYLSLPATDKLDVQDFIPGAGDTLDFQVIGASWEKQRGRELLGTLSSSSACRSVLIIRLSLAVPPSVWTTFFVALAAPELGPYSGVRPSSSLPAPSSSR